MGLLTDILQSLTGRVVIELEIDSKTALEISVQDKVVTVEVKNPSFAMEFAATKAFLGNPLKKSSSMEKLRKAGFKVKVKYMMLEFEL